MKTKHLFFAAALPLAFAACTNEEFETMNGQTAIGNDQRPLVEVKLDFQKGDADTRVDYDGTNYSWEGTDNIGAFLMDEIASENRPFGKTAEEWENETWLEHYKLVDYIHTDYPFSWSTSENAWVAPSKLQEGNYFFAAPYETYNGERQLIHYLDNQKQTGGTIAAMNEAISENQYFIGYTQVAAGAGNKETLKRVIMTPVLAPVKVTLRNIGTLAKDVEKIIIRGTNVATALTVKPTEAAYGGTNKDGSIKDGSAYNLKQGKDVNWIDAATYFNYANLMGTKFEDFKEDEYTKGSEDFVYDIASGATDYNQGDALRQIVHPSYSADEAPEYEKQAVLSFTSPVKVNPNGGEIHFAVMVNTLEKITIDPVDHSNSEKLTMDIITTQGQITNIDLTLPKEEEVGTAGLDPNTVLLNKAVTSLKPGTKNELIIQFDNNSVVKSSTKNIQDEDELLAFINWNAENTRLNTATLQRDVRFTKEMYDALTAEGYKGKLAIMVDDNNAKLLVDNDVPEEVLNILDLTSNATIVMNGDRELTKTVADKLNGAKLAIENRGTLAINGDVTTYVKLNNYGTINISEDGKLRGTVNNNITNFGTVNNKGEFYNLKNDVEEEAKGWVNTGKVNHFASNAEGATIQLSNIDDEVIIVKGNLGTIYFNTSKDLKISQLAKVEGKRTVGVNKLTVTGGTVNFDDCNNSTVKELTINGTVTLAGWNDFGKTTQYSAYHEFSNVEKASINSTVTFINVGVSGDVVFEKGCAVKFDKKVSDKVKDAKSEFDNVTFINGATVNIASDVTVTMHIIDWNGNNVTNLGTFYVDNPKSDKDYTVISGSDLKQTPSDTTINYTYITVNASVTYADSSESMELEPTDGDKDGKVNVNWTITNEEGWKKLANLSSKTVSTGENTATVYTYDIKDITIQKTIDQNFFGASYEVNGVTKYYRDDFKTVVNGKKVTLDNANLTQCNSSYGISMGELYVKGTTVTIGSGDSANIKTFLNVTKFDYSGMEASSTLTINNGYIQVAGTAQLNGKNGVGVTNNIKSIAGTNGKLVITKLGSSGELLEWDFANQKWVDLK